MQDFPAKDLVNQGTLRRVDIKPYQILLQTSSESIWQNSVVLSLVVEFLL